jgi:hypothetical protein
MVLLTTTQAAKAAIDDYLALHADDQEDDSLRQRLERLEKISLDGPVEHADLIAISRSAREDKNAGKTSRQCRLETLLKGATVYQPPPPPKPEPVSDKLPMRIMRSILITYTSVCRLQSLDATPPQTRRTARIRAHDQPSPRKGNIRPTLPSFNLQPKYLSRPNRRRRGWRRCHISRRRQTGGANHQRPGLHYRMRGRSLDRGEALGGPATPCSSRGW